MGKKVNIGRLMLQVAKRHPDKEAVVNIERNRRFSFMQLHLLSNKICNMMRDRFGMKRGDVYLVVLENDNASLLHTWTWKSEATGAWANYRDSMSEHLWMVDFVKAKLVFIENVKLEQYYAPLRERGMEIICMDPPPEKKEGLHSFWELMEGASDAETGVEHDIDTDIGVYRFTGGTTGKGKCCMYTLSNILHPMYGFYDHVEDMFSHHTRFLHIAPLSHGTGLTVMPVFFKGGTSVTMNVPDLKAFCVNIQKEKITHTLLVPTILYRFLEFDLHKLFDLTSLKTVIYGASPMDPVKLEGLLKKFGNVFVQLYGASESFPPATLLGKAEHLDQSEEGRKRLGSCGRPVAGYEVIVCDDDGKELAAGEQGEIWMRGPGTIKGYYKNPEGTQAEFTSTGWWKSGDMGYMDNKGYAYIVDRKKNMIISGGFNIYPSEVESALLSHPAVLNVAVIGIPHPEWGEAVHAEIVLKEGIAVNESELMDHVKQLRGSIKAPKSIVFVKELPMSAAGKVLHRVIREKYWKAQERRVS
jgi:fatty-acyl-CoA synthase